MEYKERNLKRKAEEQRQRSGRVDFRPLMRSGSCPRGSRSGRWLWDGEVQGRVGRATEDGEVVWGVRGSLKSMGELPSERVGVSRV